MSRTFVCNRRFKKKQEIDNDDTIKCRRESRFGCKASIEIILSKLGLWVIKIFGNVNSHDLLKSPNKKKESYGHTTSLIKMQVVRN